MASRAKKVTPEAVREIRAWYAQWEAVPRPCVVAAKHGVNMSNLYLIAKGRTHKKVQP